MKKTLIQTVTSSIFEVMETMFYFMVEEKTSAAQTVTELIGTEDVRACRITFSGKMSGAIFLIIPEKALSVMAQNFMGVDESSITTELTDGTLTEALNMVAGNALTKLDEESYMGLGIPEIIDATAISTSDNLAVFDTGKGLMMAFVEADG